MDNTNLYNFSFVDRVDSANKLSHILKDTSILPIIVGKHGVGKTYFIDNFFKKHINSKCIRITFDAEIAEHNGIGEFLGALDKINKTSFLKFFDLHYMSLVRLVGNYIIKNQFNDVSSLYNILQNTITLKTKDGSERSVAEVLYEYLLEHCSKEEIIIVFDNFHLCDTHSLFKLIPLIKKSLENKCNFRFIISLTLLENNTVKNILEEKIPREEIEILEFDSYLLFYEILIDILDISDIDKELVSKIYNYCEGNPQQLLNFMHKLDAAKALKYSDRDKKAKIIHKEAEKILSDDSTYIPLAELTIQQHFIIYVIIEFSVLVPFDLIGDIVNYVMSKTFFSSQWSEKSFLPEMFDLQRKGIIKLESKNSIRYVKMEHDLKLNFYKKEMENTQFFESINLYLFEYVSNNKNNRFLSENIDLLLAFHSYKGNITNWQTLNFDYGKKLYDKKDYINAAKVFARLTSFLDLFSASEILIFIESFYNSGNYTAALNNIKKMNECELAGENLYSFLCLKAKIYKFCLHQDEAERTVDQLLCLRNTQDDKLLNILSIEERVFANSSYNRQRSFNAYQKIKEEFKDNVKVKSIYGSFLKTSVEFYRGQLAQEDLNEAIRIAEQNNDLYELGAVYTNKGFDFFWQGKIDEALNIFQEAYNILIKVAEYEVSYPLNNMANCYIIMGDYERAIHHLKTALYWNKSDYVKITLKILLSYCSALTGECYNTDKDENFNYILNNLDSPKFADISIKIKANYLVGCIYEINGLNMYAKAYKDKAFKIAQNHDPQYLPYIWMTNYKKEIDTDIKKRLPNHKFKGFYSHSFDPWLVTLSHD